jgi:Ras-related protein Rab-1A
VFIDHAEFGRVRVNLSDPNGSERFGKLKGSFYRRVAAVLVVFDATNQESFAHLDDWRDIDRFCSDNVLLFLVATKTRAPEQTVPLVEAEEWAASHRMTFFRTDAESGEGVQAMFDQVIQESVASWTEAEARRIAAMQQRRKKKSSKCILQ